jgi:hypothetical protein
MSPPKQFNKAPILRKIDDSVSNLKSILMESEESKSNVTKKTSFKIVEYDPKSMGV